LAKNVILLSARQKQILQLVARAQTNKEIAANLNISRATVKRHVERILRRLNMKNRVEVALYAVGIRER